MAVEIPLDIPQRKMPSGGKRNYELKRISGVRLPKLERETGPLSTRRRTAERAGLFRSPFEQVRTERRIRNAMAVEIQAPAINPGSD